MIEELGVPAGYERDLIIVGTSVYKQQGKEFLVPPDPPEGVFLAPDRVPRIIIEKAKNSLSHQIHPKVCS
ncbi:MAG: hypothetical protein ACTSSK_03835 [Candidatus Heimdallarchaeota archaeon]